MSVTTSTESKPVPFATPDTMSPGRKESDSTQQSRLGLKPWLLFLSVLPFLAIPTAHLLSDFQTATGLFHYELPYYVANGRAALERGNGLFYPNPFDPSPESPAIYVHWLPGALGLAVSGCGVDPGSLILWLTFAAALGFAAATYRLVAACLPQHYVDCPVPFLAVMWSGGALSIGSAITGWLTGDQTTDLLALDPGKGMWFLNWGRNALFPTEAVYHALTACCWLAEIRQKKTAANVFLLLVATTHPWSGLELLLTINLWRSTRVLIMPQRANVMHLSTSVLMFAIFAGYYKIWLPSFEQHAALQNVWELDWSLKWSSALAAWGFAAAIAVSRLWMVPSILRTTAVQFLLCALLVAGGLSLHDRLIEPVQPLHFTRGYVWLPLFLLGLPALLDTLRSWWHRSLISRIAASFIISLLIADNLVFAAIHSWRQYQQEDGFHLDVHDRALMAELHETYAAAVVMTESGHAQLSVASLCESATVAGTPIQHPRLPAAI